MVTVRNLFIAQKSIFSTTMKQRSEFFHGYKKDPSLTIDAIRKKINNCCDFLIRFLQDVNFNSLFFNTIVYGKNVNIGHLYELDYFMYLKTIENQEHTFQTWFLVLSKLTLFSQNVIEYKLDSYFIPQ